MMQPDQAKFLAGYLLQGYQQESAVNKKVIAELPDDQTGYKPHDKVLTALDLAWHIVLSEKWFFDGIVARNFEAGAGDDFTRPEGIRTAADVLAWYDKEALPLVEKVAALTGEELAKPTAFFGMTLPLVVYLNFAVSHSIHHRGQLSTYLRAMGAKVPSIYGPSLDEPMTAATQA